MVTLCRSIEVTICNHSNIGVMNCEQTMMFVIVTKNLGDESTKAPIMEVFKTFLRFFGEFTAASTPALLVLRNMITQ